jgi:hypothetical protein
MASVAMAAQGAGLASSVVGSYYGARQQQSSLNFQADIAGINAIMAESGAQMELQRGQQQVGAVTAKAGQVKSAQRVAMAANGIDLGEGNASEVLATTDLTKEIDANTAQANAVRSAWGYRTQASNYMTDAAMKRATSDSISPWGAAATSLLGGASSVASTWYGLNKSGAFASTNSFTDGAGGMGTGSAGRQRTITGGR